jgi:hypothetical protein
MAMLMARLPAGVRRLTASLMASISYTVPAAGAST